MHLDLPGPAGRLEALLEEPPAPRGAAVVCHPHPLHGGTMHTHAVHRIARAARGQGLASLRFQFRGVGRSAGRHDGGAGEREDVRAALRFAAERYPGQPLLLCGFSFGAWMALEVAAAGAPVLGVLAAGVATRSLPSEAARSCPLPVACVQGELDALGPAGDIAALFRKAEGPRRVTLVPGASHLFTEDLGALEAACGQALAWLLEGGRGR